MKYIEFKIYDVVRVIEILNPKLKLISKDNFNLRAPKEGDEATIVEIYTKPQMGYELECVDKNGKTQWLVTVSSTDIKMELV